MICLISLSNVSFSLVFFIGDILFKAYILLSCFIIDFNLYSIPGLSKTSDKKDTWANTDWYSLSCSDLNLSSSINLLNSSEPSFNLDRRWVIDNISVTKLVYKSVYSLSVFLSTSLTDFNFNVTESNSSKSALVAFPVSFNFVNTL